MFDLTFLLAFQKIKHDRLVVACIDFGTHGSGLAFCVRNDYTKHNISKAYIQRWRSGAGITEKTPTTVLIKPNGKDFVSFGYEAEHDFSDMEPEERKKHYLFRQFKMILYKNPVSNSLHEVALMIFNMES